MRDLTELAWAVLILDVIALATGALLAAYVGRPALVLGAALAVLVTVTVATIAVLNLLATGILRLRDRRRRHAAARRSTVSG